MQKRQPDYFPPQPYWQEIPIPGDGHCGYYVFAIGLIENLYHDKLKLDDKQQQRFLHFFGEDVLGFPRAATITEVMVWIKKYYSQRYYKPIYAQLLPVLRKLTHSILYVESKWEQLAERMAHYLINMVASAEDKQQTGFQIDTFFELLGSSYLHEGAFGIALKQFLSKALDVSYQLDVGQLVQFIVDHQAEYLEGVLNQSWISMEVELPALGEYFDISIEGHEALEQRHIFRGTGAAQVQLVYNGSHFNLRTPHAGQFFKAAAQTSSTPVLQIETQEPVLVTIYTMRELICRAQQTQGDILALFKQLSWRSSEIPTQIKFAPKISQLCTEAHWIQWSYLASVINDIAGRQQVLMEQAMLLQELNELDQLLLQVTLFIKGELVVPQACSFPVLERLVAPHLDNYLLTLIGRHIQNFQMGSQGHLSGDAVPSINLQRALLRLFEILGESIKCLSPQQKAVVQKIPGFCGESGPSSNGLFAQIRSAIHHSRRRAEKVMQGKPELVKRLINDLLPALGNIIDALQTGQQPELVLKNLEACLVELHLSLTRSNPFTKHEILYLSNQIIGDRTQVLRYLNGMEDVPEDAADFVAELQPLMPTISATELVDIHRLLQGRRLSSTDHRRLLAELQRAEAEAELFDPEHWREALLQYLGNKKTPEEGTSYLLFGLEKLSFIDSEIYTLLREFIMALRCRKQEITALRLKLKQDLGDTLNYAATEPLFMYIKVHTRALPKKQPNMRIALFQLIAEQAEVQSVLQTLIMDLRYYPQQTMLKNIIDLESHRGILEQFEEPLTPSQIAARLEPLGIILTEVELVHLREQYCSDRLQDDDYETLADKIPNPALDSIDTTRFEKSLRQIPRNSALGDKNIKKLRGMLKSANPNLVEARLVAWASNEDAQLVLNLIKDYRQTQQQKRLKKHQKLKEDNAQKVKNVLKRKQINLADCCEKLFYQLVLTFSAYKDRDPASKQQLRQQAQHFAALLVNELDCEDKPSAFIPKNFNYHDLYQCALAQPERFTPLFAMLKINLETKLQPEQLQNKFFKPLNNLLTSSDLWQTLPAPFDIAALQVDILANSKNYDALLKLLFPESKKRVSQLSRLTALNVEQFQNRLEQLLSYQTLTNFKQLLRLDDISAVYIWWLHIKAKYLVTSGQTLPLRQCMLLNGTLLQQHFFKDIQRAGQQSDQQEDEEKDSAITVAEARNALHNFEDDIKKLSSLFEQLFQQGTNPLLQLAIEYLLEEIGQRAEIFVRASSYRDVGCLSLSKRNMSLLNVARKLMAHFPLSLGGELVSYYVEQLVLETQFYLDQSTVQEPGSQYPEPQGFNRLRHIKLSELNEERATIHALVTRFGFKSNFKLFHHSLNACVGVQGNLNVLVEFVDPVATSDSQLFELELALSRLLQAQVSVYTLASFQRRQGQGIVEADLALLEQAQTLPELLRCEEYKRVFNEQRWCSVNLPGEGRVSVSDHIKRSTLEQIFTQLTGYPVTTTEALANIFKDVDNLCEQIEHLLQNPNRGQATAWLQCVFEWVYYPSIYASEVIPISLRGARNYKSNSHIHLENLMQQDVIAHYPDSIYRPEKLSPKKADNRKRRIFSIEELWIYLRQEKSAVELAQLTSDISSSIAVYIGDLANGDMLVKTQSYYIRLTQVEINLIYRPIKDGLRRFDKSLAALKKTDFAILIEHHCTIIADCIARSIVFSKDKLQHFFHAIPHISVQKFASASSIVFARTKEELMLEMQHQQQFNEQRLQSYPEVQRVIRLKAERYYDILMNLIKRLPEQVKDNILQITVLKKQIIAIKDQYYRQHQADILYDTNRHDQKQQALLSEQKIHLIDNKWEFCNLSHSCGDFDSSIFAKRIAGLKEQLVVKLNELLPLIAECKKNLLQIADIQFIYDAIQSNAEFNVILIDWMIKYDMYAYHHEFALAEITAKYFFELFHYVRNLDILDCLDDRARAIQLLEQDLGIHFADPTEDYSLYAADGGCCFSLSNFNAEVERHVYFFEQTGCEIIHSMLDSSLLKRLMFDDFAVLDEFEYTHQDSADIKIRSIANGILGFHSELDRELPAIHGMIESKNLARRHEVKGCFQLEDIYLFAQVSAFPEKVSAMAPSRDKVKMDIRVQSMEDLLDFFQCSAEYCRLYQQQYSYRNDRLIINRYYEFRHLLETSKDCYQRIQQYRDKICELMQLLRRINPAVNPREHQVQLQRLTLYQDSLVIDLDQLTSFKQQLLASAFVKSRILRLLQQQLVTLFTEGEEIVELVDADLEPHVEPLLGAILQAVKVELRNTIAGVEQKGYAKAHAAEQETSEEDFTLAP